jgi:uncharacterized protein YycO
MKPVYIFRALIFLTCFACTNAAEQSTETDLLQTGDIVFQDFEFGNSRAIKLISNSEYSHVGMIVKQDNQTYVYEAVQPVGLCPFADWKDRNPDGKYLIRRLKNANEILTSSKVEALKSAMQTYIGKDYDGLFAWSDKRMYCSEVLWKIYQKALNIEAGKLQQLGDLDFSNPIVKRKLEEIYQGEIPVDETVISPQAMLECPLFETIPVQ